MPGKTWREKAFFDWLSDQRDRRDPVGDFAADAWQDQQFPRDLSAEQDLVAYMERRGSGHAAIEAAKEAWAEWGEAATEFEDAESGMDFPDEESERR
jgi:uncharacterized protein YozE (UPF0346 family)